MAEACNVVEFISFEMMMLCVGVDELVVLT